MVIKMSQTVALAIYGGNRKWITLEHWTIFEKGEFSAGPAYKVGTNCQLTKQPETAQLIKLVLYCDVENHLLEIDQVEKFEFIKSKFMKSNYNRSNFIMSNYNRSNYNRSNFIMSNFNRSNFIMSNFYDVENQVFEISICRMLQRSPSQAA